MTTPKDWHEIELSTEEIQAAEEFAREEEIKSRGREKSSWHGGDSLQNGIVGAYGMWAVRRQFDSMGFMYEVGEPAGDFDFRLPIIGEIDAKTKRVNVQPRPNYVVDVPEKQVSHNLSAFVFCYWVQPKIWIFGWLGMQEFMEKARFYRQGEKRIGEVGQTWECSEDCRILVIREAKPLSSLLEATKGVQTNLFKI